MLLIHSKLFEARNMLGSKSQGDFAKESGFQQAQISFMETGRRKQIPIKYIQFLSRKGIDLQALFDESISVEQFRKLCFNKIHGIPTDSTPDCINCELKDKEIELLKNNILDLRRALFGKDHIAERKGAANG